MRSPVHIRIRHRVERLGMFLPQLRGRDGVEGHFLQAWSVGFEDTRVGPFPLVLLLGFGQGIAFERVFYFERSGGFVGGVEGFARGFCRCHLCCNGMEGAIVVGEVMLQATPKRRQEEASVWQRVCESRVHWRVERSGLGGRITVFALFPQVFDSKL